MANQTVYPYGVGGELPTSVGIVNDLTTGGADKALSAQQGVVLGNRVIDKITTVLSSSLTQYEKSIKTDGTWQSAGHHVAFTVTPGEEIRFTVTSSTGSTGASCAFVSSVYDPTETQSGKVQVAPGCENLWALTETEYDFVVPEYAAYFIVTVNTNTYTAISKIERLSYSTLYDDFFPKDKGDTVYEGVFGEYEEVDLSEYTDTSCYLGTDDKWNDQGTHIVIPVQPRQQVKIMPYYVTGDGSFYAFLTSQYSTPRGGDPIPYVSGYSRVWINYPGNSTSGLELTVPEGAAYLCLCTLVWSGKYATWSCAIKSSPAIFDDCLLKTDLVNNITTGGAQKALTAEQGKHLASFVTDGIPAGMQRHQYSGAPIKISNQRYVAKEVVSRITSISCQGGACFGDYLFMFAGNNTTCWIYNLATQQLIQTITIPEEERGFVSSCHCNTVNFGTEYYDSNDLFPLIYVSTGYASGGNTGALVYRIVATNENDVTTYSLSLVQTLKMPGTDWTEFITGGDVCFLNYPRVFYRMNMPTLSSGDITFNLEEALGTYKITAQPTSWNGSRGQCRIYHNGKIYIISGVPGSGSPAEKSLLYVIDLATCTRESVVYLEDIGLTDEPEAVFIWRGRLCIAFRGNANIYALYFE